ncbi:hypothetical protein TI39_contig623g00003 [Zymoseptoria brevis]|uniref:Uncharacterized protein n=1 Tax=Zymoseptoria brevis TaxID=1047168 RepID=A0A0F4GHJ2_9PEZI|nr:hypothetical protein TI39_contig623g00003 [Zymoseptoria brevis]
MPGKAGFKSMQNILNSHRSPIIAHASPPILFETSTISSPIPSSSSAAIHVISKANLTVHKTLPYTPFSSPHLPLSSIRAQISLLAITGNTYTYARGGQTLHWWDAHPFPPASHLSPAEWVIVPIWDFADVVDSTIAD